MVWQRGIALAEACYRLTSGFPRHEIYGLTAQIRRARHRYPRMWRRCRTREHRFFRPALADITRVAQRIGNSPYPGQRVGLLEAASLQTLLGDCESLGK